MGSGWISSAFSVAWSRSIGDYVGGEVTTMRWLSERIGGGCFLYATLMLAAVLMACLGVTWALYAEAGVVASDPNAQSEEAQASGDKPQAAAAADRLAPDFTLTDLDGNQVSLSHFSGQPVVVNFWATWCGPCKAEIPHLIEAHERERGEVIFLAISVEEPRDIVRRFATENGMSFTILLDERGRVASDYQVKGIPTTFFISRDGEIVARYVGPMPPHRLEQGLDRIR